MRHEEGSNCHGHEDGECFWSGCPQLRDGEPTRSGRHCPLDSPPFIDTDKPKAAPMPEGTAPREWRCFHCDEVFMDRNAAAEHFGNRETDDPACKLNARDGGLLTMLREAQEELRRYRQEDTASYREFYALGADHQRALRRAEEDGYAKGLKDVLKAAEW